MISAVEYELFCMKANICKSSLFMKVKKISIRLKLKKNVNIRLKQIAMNDICMLYVSIRFKPIVLNNLCVSSDPIWALSHKI